MNAGNLYDEVLPTSPEEQTDVLASNPHVRVERIVSRGHASPPGFWYDEGDAEWVVLLAGAAGLRFENEAETRELNPGDYLHIPAHCRHRVEWTAPNMDTVWLAVHFSSAAGAAC